MGSVDSVVSEPGSAIDVISVASNEGTNGGMTQSEVNNTAGKESGVTKTEDTTQGESVPKTTEGGTREFSQKSNDSDAMYETNDETTGNTQY